MRQFLTSFEQWTPDQRAAALEIVRTWPADRQELFARECRRATAAATYASPGALAAACDPTTIQTPALDLIDGVLVDVRAGRATRQIITMAPQEGKSERVSKWFILWYLLENPGARVVIASYVQSLARGWARAVRDLIEANPELGLAVRDDMSAAHEWRLQGHKGGVVAVGVGSGLTGRPGDLVVIDDPFSGEKEASSETFREDAKRWWRTTVSTRLAPAAPVVLVQTRWHQDDLAGWLQVEFPGQWRLLNIPAQAEHDPAKGEVDILGREPGQFMISARGRDEANWLERKLEAGSRGWAALFQGHPSPAEGGVFKREWWRYAVVRPVQLGDGTWSSLMDREVISMDAAFKDTDGSDYVVIQVWGQAGARVRLVDMVRGRMDFDASVRALVGVATKWPRARLKLVEDKANGSAILSHLRTKVSGLVPVTPTDSKLARAYAITPYVEAGNVELPDPAWCPWANDVIEEAANFPNGTNDDIVDAMTQAVERMLGAASGLQGFMSALAVERGEPASGRYVTAPPTDEERDAPPVGGGLRDFVAQLARR